MSYGESSYLYGTFGLILRSASTGLFPGGWLFIRGSLRPELWLWFHKLQVHFFLRELRHVIPPTSRGFPTSPIKTVAPSGTCYLHISNSQCFFLCVCAVLTSTRSFGSLHNWKINQTTTQISCRTEKGLDLSFIFQLVNILMRFCNKSVSVG